MRYALVVTTHGDAPHLAAAVESFAAMVTPSPHRLLAVVDGRQATQPPSGPLGPWQTVVHDRQRGFGAAVLSGWRLALATARDCDYVFWTENDFTFDRPVNLEQLAFLLDRDHRLAQVSLMRNAYSQQEHDAGGLYELRRADYEHHHEDDLWWMEHRAYFTTNPALMRRAFMCENPWPDDGDPYPEGRYGIDLHERGYHSAVMGAGEVWAIHHGVRTGKGY